MSPFNRRQFLKSGVATAAAATTVVAAPANERPKKFRSPSSAGRGVKLACSTAPWRAGGADFEKALAGIAAAGYEWVEASDDEIWPFHEDPEKLKKLLGQHGLGLATLAVRGNFADREQRLKNISRAVLLARALEQLEAGVLVIEGEWGNVEKRPMNYHVYSSNLSEVGALVFEETGLHCAYRFRESEAADVRKIIATSDSRYTKFCFDTLYFAQLGIDPVPMIQAYGPRLIHVHLRDGVKSGSDWKEVPAGKGSVKVRPVVEALCQARFNGWASIQEPASGAPEKDADTSRRYLAVQLEAAAFKYPDDSPAGDASGNPHAAHEAAHVHEQRRSLVSGLVMIGAAMTQPSALLQPAAFRASDGSNPMQQMTHDMKSHRNRPAAPLLPKDPNFVPFFFSGEEYADVSALADTIIPVTNTPGALDARADEYADLMIWIDEASHDAVKKQAARFREVCVERHGKPFAQLPAAQRTALLTELTGKNVAAADRPAVQFFNRIRGLTVRAYYASPQGLLEELGYKGNTYVAEFKGCTHPEHHKA